MPHVAHVGHSRFVYAVAQRTERIDPSPVRCCVKALALRASYLGDDAVGDVQQTAFEPVGKALFLPESPAAVLVSSSYLSKGDMDEENPDGSGDPAILGRHRVGGAATYRQADGTMSPPGTTFRPWS